MPSNHARQQLRVKIMLKKLTRDDTKHGGEYYHADEVDDFLVRQTLAKRPSQPDQNMQRKAWNTMIRDSVDSLLEQAGYQSDSSARHQLAMMNFDNEPHNNSLQNNALVFVDALNIALGCKDYGGGYRGNSEQYEIYQHGIQTVINTLRAAHIKGLKDSQVAVLHRIGFEAFFGNTGDAN